MEPRDCTWCGSARSIEYDVCQVCLMRFPEPADELEKVVVVLEERDLEAEEVSAPHDATGRAVAE